MVTMAALVVAMVLAVTAAILLFAEAADVATLTWLDATLDDVTVGMLLAMELCHMVAVNVAVFVVTAAAVVAGTLSFSLGRI